MGTNAFKIDEGGYFDQESSLSDTQAVPLSILQTNTNFAALGVLNLKGLNQSNHRLLDTTKAPELSDTNFEGFDISAERINEDEMNELLKLFK